MKENYMRKFLDVLKENRRYERYFERELESIQRIVNVSTHLLVDLNETQKARHFARCYTILVTELDEIGIITLDEEARQNLFLL
jgi:hypothetical protein